jgi:hypothetical protein
MNRLVDEIRAAITDSNSFDAEIGDSTRYVRVRWHHEVECGNWQTASPSMIGVRVLVKSRNGDETVAERIHVFWARIVTMRLDSAPDALFQPKLGDSFMFGFDGDAIQFRVAQVSLEGESCYRIEADPIKSPP